MAISKDDELFYLNKASNIVKVRADSDERRGLVNIYFQGELTEVSSFALFRTMRAAEIAAVNRRLQ